MKLGVTSAAPQYREREVGNSQPSIGTARAAQLPLMIPQPAPPVLLRRSPKGMVYTKRWVVEMLLDLAGITEPAEDLSLQRFVAALRGTW